MGEGADTGSTTLRLTPRQRLETALTGGRPDVFPAAPCYLILFLDDFQRADYIDHYRRLLRGRSRCRIDHAQDTRFRADAIRRSYGIFKARPDWMEIPQGISHAWAERTDIVLADRVLYYEDRASGKRLLVDSQPLSG